MLFEDSPHLPLLESQSLFMSCESPKGSRAEEEADMCRTEQNTIYCEHADRNVLLATSRRCS